MVDSPVPGKDRGRFMYVKRTLFVLLCLSLGAIYWLLTSESSPNQPEFIQNARQATKEFASTAKKTVGDFFLQAQIMAVSARAQRKRDYILSLLFSPTSIAVFILAVCVIQFVVFVILVSKPDVFMSQHPIEPVESSIV